jgi:HAD superfamily hydrolase (TIGR01509 family)
MELEGAPTAGASTAAEEEMTPRKMNGVRGERLRGVLFDLDGTLVDSKFPSIEAKAAILRKLEELGIETSGITPEMIGMMEILTEVRAKVRLNGALSLAEVEAKLGSVLDQFDIESLSNSEPREGARLVLDSLATRGFKLGIVTSSGRKGTNLVLERFRLMRYFSAVITRNDTHLPKPSGEGILRAVQILGCNRSDVAYVGDNRVDILAAKDAGAEAIALIGGSSPPERLRQESPDAIIKSLHELLNIL